jgi:hypothetical protein
MNQAAPKDHFHAYSIAMAAPILRQGRVPTGGSPIDSERGFLPTTGEYSARPMTNVRRRAARAGRRLAVSVTQFRPP